jgi:hypothetical protein
MVLKQLDIYMQKIVFTPTSYKNEFRMDQKSNYKLKLHNSVLMILG